MPTMKQKVDRIDAARLAQISAVNTKNPNANLPNTTGIEDIAPAILAIPTGGSENPFLTETDLSYMFDYRQSSDDKIIAGIQRMSQNNITDLNHCFYYFNDNRVSTVPAEAGIVIGCIQNMIRNHPDVDVSYMLSNFNFPDVSAYNFTLDLSEIQLSDNIRDMFHYIGINSTSYTQNGKLIILIDKNTFANSTNCADLFQNSYYGIYLKNKDSKICIGGNMQTAFQYARVIFLDVNNTEIKELTFEIKNTSSFQGAFSSCYTPLERLNFINGDKIINYSNMLSNMYSMKSVTGLDFSNIDGNTNGNMFNTSGSTYFNNFGELGFVNGSTFRSNRSVNFNISRIWHGVTSDIRDGQTIGYWYEKFANSLGTKTSTNTHTITINSTLYNSLTQAQKELITNKGYVLASVN